MIRFILAAAVLLALSELAPARAQFAFGPAYPYGGYGSSYSYRGGFGFSVGGPHVRVSGFYGGFVSRAAYFAPPVFGTPYRYGYGPPYFGPPVVIVVPVPIIVGGNVRDPDAEDAAAPPPRLPNRALFPKVASSDFIVISPKGGPTGPPAGRLPPRPPGPMIEFDPLKRGAPVKAEVVEADPKREAVRLIALGRASFAEGDYGPRRGILRAGHDRRPDRRASVLLAGASEVRLRSVCRRGRRYSRRFGARSHMAEGRVRPVHVVRGPPGALRDARRGVEEGAGRQSQASDARISSGLSVLVQRRQGGSEPSLPRGGIASARARPHRALQAALKWFVPVVECGIERGPPRRRGLHLTPFKVQAVKPLAAQNRREVTDYIQTPSRMPLPGGICIKVASLAPFQDFQHFRARNQGCQSASVKLWHC